jgi:SAM-dependent methyltransferase
MTEPGYPDEACPICGCFNATPYIVVNGFCIVRCGACGTMHVSPRPGDAALTAHYQDPSYFHGQGNQGYRDYAQIRKALTPLFRRRLAEIESHFASPGRLLDFGSAAGYFLEEAKANGWTVTGVEISAQMAKESAERLSVPVATSIDELGSELFDVITLWEVIEHLRQPVSVVSKLGEHLRPGGLLAVSTPNTGHWQAQLEPQTWEGYRLPSHLVFFTKITLEDALRRAGFVRARVRGLAPLPMLPSWLRRASAPLRSAVVSGEARPWTVALLAWRAVRAVGWGWQRIARPGVDAFATLEAWAVRP